jgi:hypothetical protein
MGLGPIFWVSACMLAMNVYRELRPKKVSAPTPAPLRKDLLSKVRFPRKLSQQ